MRTLLLRAGAVILLLGAIFLAVAAAQVKSQEEVASQEALNNTGEQWSKTLGYDYTGPPADHGDRDALEAWKDRRIFAWFTLAAGGVVFGLGLLAPRTQRVEIANERSSGGTDTRNTAAAPPKPPSTRQSSKNLEERLRMVDSLRDSGAISPAEHSQRRARMLDDI